MDSKLQIISGIYHGRKLKLPPNARPTQNRARIALFNMLESGIITSDADIRVWDAFGGSGAFGLECVSRYPNAVVSFTDIAPTSIKTIRDNLKNFGVDSRVSVIQSDAIAAVGRLGANADVVFVDAPYDNADLGRAFVKKLGVVAKTGAILIWEQESTNFVPINENLWDVLRDKTYGRARFLILEKK